MDTEEEPQREEGVKLPEVGVDDAEVKTVRRRQVAKLDASKLLSDKGIPYIRRHLVKKGIRFKGKGHEKSDLNKILGTYQMWAHTLFPKANFDDFIKLCAKTGPTIRHYRKDWVSIEQGGFFGNEDLDLMNSFATDGLGDSVVTENVGTVGNDSTQNLDDPFLDEYSDNDDLFVSRNNRGRNVIDDDDDDNDLFVTNRSMSAEQSKTQSIGSRDTSTTPALSTASVSNGNLNDDEFPDDDELEEIMRNEQSRELDNAEEEAAMEFGF